MDAVTFAVERHGGFDAPLLCTVDAKGETRPIALFLDENCVRVFNETLALAKAAAHEHGRSGI